MDEIVYVLNKGVLTIGDILAGRKPTKDDTSVKSKIKLSVIERRNDISMKHASDALSLLGCDPKPSHDMGQVLPVQRRPDIIDKNLYDTLVNEGQQFVDYNKIRGSIPQYNTMPVKVVANNYIITAINMVRLTDERANVSDASTKWEPLYDQCLSIGEKHYLGHASRLGQLGRIEAVIKAGKYALNTQAIHKHWMHDPEAEYNRIKKYMPFKTPTLRLPRNNADMQLSTEQAIKLKVATPKINLTAESGPPFGSKVKRKDTIYNDSIAFEQMLGSDYDMSWYQISRLKAKSEVYKTEDAYKKVRNYYVYNSGASMPALSLVQAATSALDMNYHCLVGFSLTGGFMNKLLNHIRRTGRGLMVFSDNLFYFRNTQKGIKWKSLDGVKMEASLVNQSQMEHVLWTCITKGTTTDINSREAQFIIKNYPPAFINAPVIWDTIVFKNIGMNSGLPAVLLANQHNMANVASILENHVLDTLTDVEINNLIIDTGVQIETTLSTVINHDKEGLQELDFLGYDLFTENGYHYPVLSRERIIKALMFDKTNLRDTREMTGKERGMFISTTKIGKWLVLYLLGGWAHSDLEEFLVRIIKVEQARVESTFQDLPSEDELRRSLTIFNDEQIPDLHAIILSALKGSIVPDKKWAQDILKRDNSGNATPNKPKSVSKGKTLPTNRTQPSPSTSAIKRPAPTAIEPYDMPDTSSDEDDVVKKVKKDEQGPSSDEDVVVEKRPVQKQLLKKNPSPPSTSSVKITKIKRLEQNKPTSFLDIFSKADARKTLLRIQKLAPELLEEDE
jgi:hypothetical protein